MMSLCLYTLFLLSLVAVVSSKETANPAKGQGLMQTGKTAPAVLPRIHELREIDGNEMESMLLAEDSDAMQIEDEVQPGKVFAKTGDKSIGSEGSTFAAVILQCLPLLPDILVAATAMLSIRILCALLLPAYFSSKSGKRIEEQDGEVSDDELASVDVKARRHYAGDFAQQKTDDCGCTALHMAAHDGDVAELVRLLETGADLNAREVWGETPLHLAARSGSTECCDKLLAHGAELDAENDDGVTPLVVAAEAGCEATCKLLLDRGAGAGDADDVDMPPLLCSLLMFRLLPKEAAHL
eukprot:TRINITY_DN49835_c0_g1_i1.p1 TRINITY_DN49835_c0_g1~~TRINITY_DN49835_c0_g1_i1.p1  ORF type:complete len:297 (-),score=78.74 TRINITY_DN49835_c0_g1_i1:122-1012(-)